MAINQAVCVFFMLSWVGVWCFCWVGSDSEWDKGQSPGYARGMSYEGRRSYLHVAHSGGDRAKTTQKSILSNWCMCERGGEGWLSNKVTDRSKDKVLNIWKPGPYHRFS